MDLKEEAILGDVVGAHWYYEAKGRAIEALLGNRPVAGVLDVGAGSGVFSRRLLAHGRADSAVCVDPHYPVERTETHAGKPISFVKSVDTVSQPLMLLIDVLEHVDDDVGLLREYVSKMPPGGTVLISVPAFPFLWSAHDVFLEHKRRYTLADLEHSAREAGLTPLRGRNFFGALFPAIAVIRLLRRWRSRSGAVAPRSDLKVYPPAINRLLILLHNMERVTLFRGNRWFGLSAFCLCQKT